MHGRPERFTRFSGRRAGSRYNASRRRERGRKGRGKEEFVQGAETVSRGLLDASSEAKAAASSLRRTGLLQGVFLLAVALVIIGTAYVAGGRLVKSRVDDLAELKAVIRAEQATLAELQGKTWGLELVKYQDGTRAIILPKGVKVDRTGAVPDGRTGIVIKP
jgi:hypothetical protein